MINDHGGGGGNINECEERDIDERKGVWERLIYITKKITSL